MKGTTHIAIGVAAAAVLGDINHVSMSYLLPSAIIGSLIPDIDTGSSIINKFLIRDPKFRDDKKILYFGALSLFSFLIFCQFYIKPFLYIGLVAAILALSSHRGIFHTVFIPLMALYFGSKTNYFLQYEMMAVGIGLHLVADMFNKSGIMLFFPFTRKEFRMPITFYSRSFTMSIIELVIVMCSFIGVLLKFDYSRNLMLGLLRTVNF